MQEMDARNSRSDLRLLVLSIFTEDILLKLQGGN